MIHLLSSDTALYFNPRPREGSDDTTPERRDCFGYFNPRPREGSDLLPVWLSCRLDISIHAPVKGATKQFRQ